MGCLLSKSFPRNLNPKSHLINGGAYSSSHHIVSLKSTTYGLLNLDVQPTMNPKPKTRETEPSPSSDNLKDLNHPNVLNDLPVEVINAWELMKGLEDEIPRKSPKSIPRSPLKLLKHGTSPKKFRRAWGKENTGDEFKSNILSRFEKKCPPGGENKVIIYTTTLRGIRKTFENCNLVRSLLDSKSIQSFERDVSMDLGFREELRTLMGHLRVPILFVKGRLIGGAEEVVRLEEEGRLGFLLDGIPREICGCMGCGGVRFVMCSHCNGSCKVRKDDGKNRVTIKCGNCNENGLIRCPICCKN